MDELTHARLIILLVVLVFVAFWGGGSLRNRRRHARFAALARSLGGEIVREGELSRFSVDIGGRTLEVRLQHIRRPYSKGSGQWYLITETALRGGASDLHSTDIRERWRRPQAAPDEGDPLREEWLNDRVRAAIDHFFALDLPLDPLGLQEGRLVHKSHLPVKRFEGEILRELLTRQAAVAAAIEQTV